VIRKMAERGKKKPHGAGRSSFSLIDPDKVFGELRLKRGAAFLDMASGPGHYAMAALDVLGQSGVVYAVDLWEEGIATLQEHAEDRGLRNLRATVADISKRIPVESHSIDVCLMATVLHELNLSATPHETLEEAARVLIPHGILAIIEFKKIPRPPGPPIHIRLGPEDVEKLVIPHGFEKKSLTDVGPYNYLITFLRREG